MKPQSAQAKTKSQKPAAPTQPSATGELKQDPSELASPQEVAGRAYANYLNQGSQHGHDVDDWLAAEAQLQEERNLIRVGGGGFPNRS